jgi:hypothetical protein
MAERQLRSEKRDDSADIQATDFSESPVVFTDEQVDKVAETVSSQVSIGIHPVGQVAVAMGLLKGMEKLVSR